VLSGAASVEAKSLTVGSVLEERYPFAVPRYQRAYAWGDEAVSFFVRDIENLLHAPSGTVSHFFGGMVCIELIDNQRVRPLSYEVVDGQQRLATFTLALACVVRVAAEIANEEKDPAFVQQALTLRDDTAETYLTWKERNVSAGRTMVRSRVTLSLADDEVFQALTSGEGTVPKAPRESHKLLIEAYNALLTMTRSYVGVPE
jgi:hypothetical protein